METKNHWVKSKWSLADLNGKSVEFRFVAQGYGPIEGNGKILVAQRPDRTLSINIEVDKMGKNWAERVVTRFHLPQDGADAIEMNQPGSKAEFSCFRIPPGSS